MQIFLIYDNQKFRFEYNNRENPFLQVKYLFSKLPKRDECDEDKEYVLIWEDEVFKKEDSIDILKYNNKEFVFILLKKNLLKISSIDEDQVTNESKKRINNINNCNMTMAQMIKKLTNAKEEIKPKQRKNNAQNHHSNDPNLNRRFIIDRSILDEYDIDSDNDYYDEYDEDYESDVIMVNGDPENQIPLDESEHSFSDMDVSMNGNNFEVNEDHLSQLVSMGFNAEMSDIALRRCNNRIDLAIEFLMFIS